MECGCRCGQLKLFISKHNKTRQYVAVKPGPFQFALDGRPNVCHINQWSAHPLRLPIWWFWGQGLIPEAGGNDDERPANTSQIDESDAPSREDLCSLLSCILRSINRN